MFQSRNNFPILNANPPCHFKFTIQKYNWMISFTLTTFVTLTNKII